MQTTIRVQRIQGYFPKDALEELTGTVCIADDVLIYGQTAEENDENLENFLQRCLDRGIRLSRENIEYKTPSVAFHRHVLTADGSMVDPLKIKAIEAMPPPADVKAIGRLNGMVNYLSRFLPTWPTLCCQFED